MSFKTKEECEEMDKINQLKQDRDAVVLAHYYVDAAVQDAADYVGDSYYLSRVSNKVDSSTLVFCGVRFMAESAKIMNPDKTVLMPDAEADCPLAHMAHVEQIQKMRDTHEDLAVVCYINSTMQTKAHSDVCVTSSNAVDIIAALPQKNIYFIPDQNLGKYIAKKMPDKNFYFNEGYCYVHEMITPEGINRAKQAHPGAPVLAHPESPAAVLQKADYIGGTTGIIDQVDKMDAEDFIICTESGVLHALKTRYPDKNFHFTHPLPVCDDMKRITLQKLEDSLAHKQHEVVVDEQTRKKALQALEKMHQLAAQPVTV